MTPKFKLGFRLEKRGETWVLQYDNEGGCYPASIAERTMWQRIQVLERDRSQLLAVMSPSGRAVYRAAMRWYRFVEGNAFSWEATLHTACARAARAAKKAGS